MIFWNQKVALTLDTDTKLSIFVITGFYKLSIRRMTSGGRGG